MSEDYGNDFITLTDEEGNDIELEHLDTLEYKGDTYMAFTEAHESETDILDEDATELIILKVEETNGEDMLVTIEDDKLLDELFELFSERLADDGEFDEEEEDK